MPKEGRKLVTPPENPLSKRIKRHVIGRTRSYFAATAPGFEGVCFQEMSDLALPMESASMVSGGVEFTGRLKDCYLANLHLRTANRILMRIHTFKARSFSQFESKTAEIPWELYLPFRPSPQIHTTTRRCRLYHTDAVSERLMKNISKHVINDADRKALKEETQMVPKIFVRGVNDYFTISIDSSGEHLHKRGVKKSTGRAPLRETIAAAALLLAGYSGVDPIVDPMCGTGTFAWEAAMMARNIPPGWHRQFAFMHWPSFRSAQWDYFKRTAASYFVCSRTPLIFASDRNPATCKRLKASLARHRFLGNIKVHHRDFFEFLPEDLTDQTGMVTINPPYGRRLENRRSSEQLFIKICIHLKRSYKGWKLILIAPNQKLALKVPFKLTAYPISHGGLRPVMMIGAIS
jgi:putative N6-adenine-specific DNA methylase